MCFIQEFTFTRLFRNRIKFKCFVRALSHFLLTRMNKLHTNTPTTSSMSKSSEIIDFKLKSIDRMMMQNELQRQHSRSERREAHFLDNHDLPNDDRTCSLLLITASFSSVHSIYSQFPRLFAAHSIFTNDGKFIHSGHIQSCR